MTIAQEQSLLGLAGKVALITGGGAGIGRATAELFAQAGMRVAVAEIDPERAANVRRTLEDAGCDCLVSVADVRDGPQVVALLDDIATRFARLDVLVNNVGDFLGIKGEFVDSHEDQWQALYEINLRHIFHVTRAAIPLMQRSGDGGSIINLSTVEAFRGIPLTVVYSAFNAAITGFTQSLAVELGQYGIRVNAIAPETTNSAQITATPRVPPENRENLKRWFPIGRFGEGSDSAGAALFLASDLLSGWVSGTTVFVDGGALAAGAWMRMPNDDWTHLPIISRDGYTPRSAKE
ncbi:SDR family NAD(P)-dependent oxidoreductase [Thalassorhabdomicrobium marinisediminis]|uniref:SDR family NAD(P)-dependent oxidoreductase n=1 Tax=Thalassorhabdomicrobium marinisediminis TaxID=2170577 RepID=UPI002490CFF8|nr:SDR family NAD(P)-dependent oxidoreductase [Thalassorhabdomicrobium marinisediminis]